VKLRGQCMAHVNIVSPLASQHVPYRRWDLAMGSALGMAPAHGGLGRIPPMCEVGACLL
jgi:hypothetical protein